MRRSSYAVTVLAGGVAVMVGLLVLSKSHPGGQPGVLSSPVSTPQTPGEAGGAVPAEVQPLGRPLPEQVATPGVAQEGVDASQATAHLEEETAADIPAFTEPELNAHPGEIVALTFRNTSDPAFNYRHAWVLVKPGSERRVLIEAEKAGPLHGWIPETPDVLAHTRLLLSGESETIAFRAPAQPGDYPFLCTFPEHGLKMRGVLHVRPAG